MSWYEKLEALQRLDKWLDEWILQPLKDLAEMLWAQWEIIYNSLLELNEKVEDFIIAREK